MAAKKMNGNHLMGSGTPLCELEGASLDRWVRHIPELFPLSTARPKESKHCDENATLPQAQATNSPLFPSSLVDQAWNNLSTALHELNVKVKDLSCDGGDEKEVEVKSPTKRRKLTQLGDSKNEGKKKKARKQKYTIIDPYNLYIHTIPKRLDDNNHNGDRLDPNEEEEEAAKELRSIAGGKLTELMISGLVNGMSGVIGGVVADPYCDPISGVDTEAVPTAGNASLAQLIAIASILDKAVQTQVQADALASTPLKIKEMLVPDLSLEEFQKVRKRIHGTVILGKGLAHPAGEKDIPPTAISSSGGVHDAESFKRCKTCGNNDQSAFVSDKKNGDIICRNCGTVAAESLMHEGAQFRTFEGEADRNHHGDAPNRLFSDAYNMRTKLGKVYQTSSGGGHDPSSVGKHRGTNKALQNVHKWTELNDSGFGDKELDRRTRIGYKDKQKREAFSQIKHCGDALNLNEAVIQHAMELFASFRDDRELVQQFTPVIAACLCEAFVITCRSYDRNKTLGQDLSVESPNGTGAAVAPALSQRDAVTLGEGRALVSRSDAVALGRKRDDKKRALSAVAEKPVSTWDLDDCRSWLLEASQSIARNWIDDRKRGRVMRIRAGGAEELEGTLMLHVMNICSALETEMTKKDGKKKQQKAIDVPSKHLETSKTPRTAGQYLILKTARMLGKIVDDEPAGDAIHKELRILLKNQEARRANKGRRNMH